MNQKSRRIIRKPQRFGEWEGVDCELVKKEIRTRSTEKLWEIEDVLEESGSKVLVKWSNWEGEPSWIDLENNPELRSFLQRNSANPHSCTLHKNNIETSKERCPLPDAILLIRQCIFDILGEAKGTNPKLGCRRRVSIRLPLSKEDFEKHILESLKLPVGEGNITCQIPPSSLTDILGPGWNTRSFASSTEAFVSLQEYIHLSWGYKKRIQYDHNDCSRCQWKGEEGERPSTCNTMSYPVIGPPWLSLTMTVARRNTIATQLAKKRKSMR